ncbi:hypothetical protein AAG906_005893 [Vitis piasezkii]
MQAARISRKNLMEITYEEKHSLRLDIGLITFGLLFDKFDRHSLWSFLYPAQQIPPHDGTQYDPTVPPPPPPSQSALQAIPFTLHSQTEVASPPVTVPTPTSEDPHVLMDRLEQRLRQLRTSDIAITWDDFDGLLAASLPTKFRMPEIERYTRIGYPRIHWRLYSTIMRAHGLDETQMLCFSQFRGIEIEVRGVGHFIYLPLEEEDFPRFARHLMGFPHTNFGSLVQALYGIEEGITRILWCEEQRSGVVGAISSVGLRPLKHLRASYIGTASPHRTGHKEASCLIFCHITAMLCTALQKLTKAGLLGPGHETDRCTTLRHAIQDLIDQGMVHLGQLSATINPLSAHTTHTIPSPTDSMHSIDFTKLDDHIHMLSWDESELEPIVSYQIYEIGIVILGPQMSAPFGLVPKAASVQTATVEPSIFPYYSVRTPFVLISDVDEMCSMLSAGVEWYDSSPSQPLDPWRVCHPRRRVRTIHVHCIYLSIVRSSPIVIRTMARPNVCHPPPPLLSIRTFDFCPSNQIVRAYDNTRREVMSTLEIELLIDPTTFITVFQVLRIPTSFNLLLGRPWIHRAGAIPYSFHQKISHSDDELLMIGFTFDEHGSTVVLDMMRSMSYLPGMGLGRRHHGPSDPHFDSMLTTPSSPDCMSLMTLYFSDEIDEHGTFAEIGDITDGVVPCDKYVDEMLTMTDQPRELRIGLDLSTNERGGLAQLLRLYLNVFAWSNEDMSGLDPSIVLHHLPLLLYARPVNLQVKEEIQKQLSVGFLSVVEYLEWLANVILIPKKDGKVRVCVDFRDLNKVSPKDDFLLPHIDIVMPFGLKNAETTYQRATTTLFHDMMHRMSRLRLNPKKCTFGVTSGKLLGYMVNERILVPPTPGYPLLSYLSVSDVVLGYMLAQLYDSGKERAIYYLSKRMLDYEMRYVTIERYCLALVWATPRLRHYMTEYLVHLMSRLDPLRYLFDRPALIGRCSSDASRWRMYFNGAANHSRYKIRVLLISSHCDHIPISVCLVFSDRHPAMNNIVEYEACILGLETSLELGVRQMKVFGDSNLVLRQIQGHWKTRDVKLRPYHAYLELLVERFDDLSYTHLPRAQNQFVDALATLAFMIDIPTDIVVRPLLIELRSVPAYCYLIDEFLRLGAYPEATTTKDKRASRQLVARFVICRETLYKQSIDGMLLLCLDRTSTNQVMRVIHAGVLWGIDIIGKISLKSSSGLEFILVDINYFTKWVEAALYARLTSSGVARATPYSLVYGMEVVLPQQIPEADWAQARLDQLNLLDERRLRAVDHVRAYQRKMTRAFKKWVKPRPLRIGDLVLKGVDPRGRCMVDGSRWKPILRADQRGSTKEQLCVVVLSIITFIDDVTSLHVGFERIITPLCVLCFTIILIFAFDSSIAFHPSPFLTEPISWFHPEAMGCRLQQPLLGQVFEIWMCSLFYHDPPIEPSLSHSVEPIFSDVVMILGFWSDLLYVPIESLLNLLRSTLLGREMFIHIDDHSLYDVCRDEPSVEHDLRAEHPLRVMKSLSDPSLLTFKAIITSQFRRSKSPSFGVRATIIVPSLALSRHRFSFRHSKPSSLLDSRSSHHRFSVSAFRVIIASQFRSSEPSSLLSFGVQSHHRLSVLTFRTTIVSQFQRSKPPSSFPVWCLESLSLLSFGVQSHHRFSDSAFRAIIASQFWRSEPSSLPGVQSHHPFSVSVFRTIIILNFGIQSHHHS